MPSKQLLIMPPNWLGDVIMAQPAMRAFAEHYARQGYDEMVVHGRAWLADLLPFLDLNGARFSDTLPQGSDCAVIFPNSFSSAWKAYRSGAAKRIGFRGQWRAALLKPGYAPQLDMLHQHHRDYYLNLAEQAGIEIGERQVKLGVPESQIRAGAELMRQHGLDPERTLCIAPGAQFGGAKRYPAESYRQLLGRLATEGWQLLILGTPAERPIGEQCLADVTTPSWNSSGETSLTQALQLLAACRLLICNDSGLMHVAAGMNRPVIGIFGATDPDRTAPSGGRVRLLYRPAHCSPCLQRECTTPGQPCMANISPDLVHRTATALLEV